MQATITWRPASEPPKFGPLLLAAKYLGQAARDVIAGHYEAGRWYDDDGVELHRNWVVTHWAEMPAHPEQK